MLYIDETVTRPIATLFYVSVVINIGLKTNKAGRGCSDWTLIISEEVPLPTDSH